ncbi:PH domain-containing protein [Staphylococcus ureilyticus]|uniref:PH domain-containing protein n=1 Tax=Staphylococcus ureilyticus TaxID=94138 RepID=UPI0029000E98|nr:PH domain-containing protein [Staphylococcus ureilyticus]MDU0463248.1 PH domain-containing protein [Staphylococcus ureilyticus]
MYSPQKLHPISYITGIIEAIKQNIILIFIFLVFNLRNFDFTDYKSYIYPGIITIIFLISFIIQILKVYNTRYWIENDHFILATGIFSKERKELNIRRIQTLDTSQGIINQIVGGVILQIKTPSDGIELDTVSKNQSDFIQQTLKEKQQKLTQNSEIVDYNNSFAEQDAEKEQKMQSPAMNIYKLNFKELLFMALTSGVIGVAFATLSPVMFALSDILPWHKITNTFSEIFQTAFMIILMIVVLVIVVSYIFGTIIEIVRNFNYTVKQQGTQLNIQYGLFNVKSITVPTDRVQAIVERQSFIRKLFGYTSIHFVITSDMDGVDKDDVTLGGNVMILPFIKRQKAFYLINHLIPDMKFTEPKLGMPWRGFHRCFWRESLVLLIGATIATYYWSVWSFVIAGCLILIMILHSFIVIKSSGLNLNHDELVVRNVTMFGFKNTYFKHNKLLGMEMSENPFLIRSNLANFKFIIAKAAGSAEIGLKYSEVSHVEKLKSWYLRGDFDE